ncbi:MAG TPA: hypothetical protein VEY32_00495 [Flavisolibacter sp.]|nr:hypothetical protein [Flavisolibacter sp.]
MNVIRNIGATFGYAGAGASTATVYTTVATAVGLRGLTATQAGLDHYGKTGESGWGAAGKGVFGMEIGMYESGKNIVGDVLDWKKEDGTEYSAGWQDIVGLTLLLSPVHRAPKELNAKKGKPVNDGEPVRDGDQKKADEGSVKDANTTPEETTKKEGEHEAFEAGALSREAAIQLSQEAYARAENNAAKLPSSQSGKTTASDGINTVSGHAENRISQKTRDNIGVTDVPPQDVMSRAEQIQHKLNENASIDNGVPGQASASHAEKQVMTKRPGDPVGVSRPMCKNCKGFAQKQADNLGREVVITDPEGTYIFRPGKKPIFNRKK